MKKDKISANTLIFLNEILNQGVWSELNKLMKLKTNGSKLIETKGNLKKGISALYAYIDFLTENENKVASRVNSSDRIYVSQDNWKSAIVDEFLKFDSRGSEYITTVSECFIKTMALINASQKPHNRDTAYYRGQVDSSWNLQSSIGRKIASNKIPKNRNTVSKFELDSLRKWQIKVSNDSELLHEIFQGSEVLEKSNPEWWALKQHFDDDPKTGGTRLVDWTSSPLCGLYFACANWDGSVDDKIDGGLFMSARGTPAISATKDYISKVPISESIYLEELETDVEKYFDLKNHIEYSRTIYMDGNNQRQISQDGHFMFNAEFEKSLKWHFGLTPFFFIIPKESKKEILKELFSLGYTPNKIIRGRKGREAQIRLKQELNIH